MVEEGKRAPAFTLPTDGVEKFKLSDHKDKIVVLFFYPKDDTSRLLKFPFLG